MKLFNKIKLYYIKKIDEIVSDFGIFDVKIKYFMYFLFFDEIVLLFFLF